MCAGERFKMKIIYFNSEPYFNKAIINLGI